MRPEFEKCRKLKKQAGLGLATALFVITVLGLIAVFMSQLVTSNVASFSEEMELVQSFYAAESGAQLAMNNIFFPLTVSSTQCQFSPAISYSFSSGALNSCSAEVRCEEVGVDVDGDGNNEAFYTITSAGTCGLVTRTIQVRAVSGQ